VVVTEVLRVIDPKTTGMMLYRFPVIPSDSEPLHRCTRPNKEKPPFFQMCVNLRNPNVLDFFTEIIILYSWSYRISTQGINISVP
jgi:hypothetical protein